MESKLENACSGKGEELAAMRRGRGRDWDSAGGGGRLGWWFKIGCVDWMGTEGGFVDGFRRRKV